MEGIIEDVVGIVVNSKLKGVKLILAGSNDGFDVDKVLLAAIGVFVRSLKFPKIIDGEKVSSMVDFVGVVGFCGERPLGVLLCIITELGSSEGITSARLLGEKVESTDMEVG